MQRLLAFLKMVINTLLAKSKRLVIHVIKHPLGSIWWAVKMYFALMFFSLFVACSFGAFANTALCPIGQYKEGYGCTTSAPSKAGWSLSHAAHYGEGDSPQAAFSEWAKKANNENTETGQSGFCKYTTKSTTTHQFVKYLNYTIDFNVKTSSSTSWASTEPGVSCPSTPPSNNTSLAQAYPNELPTLFYCPPEIPYTNFTNKVTIGDTHYCVKPAEQPQDCFSDPKYGLSNFFHFSPQDAGKGKICVMTDSEGLCPFQEMDGAKGVFRPGPDLQSPCTDQPPSDPMPPPEPPENCTTTPSGMKVCKEDPNDKCTANSSGALSCGESCGYMNAVFVCFENPDVDPDQPDEPEEPDVPRPPSDDNIEDPTKPLADMLKSDFKDVQRGVETRLDGFAADMANLLKAEKSGNEQIAKNTAQGNKLLNSINQNTADTVKELKKLSEPGEAVEGIEKPEFEEKNDWQQKNFGTVMKAKGDEIMQLPIMQSINNFFDVSFSGSCPTYSTSVWVFEINIDQFCSPQVQALFPYISAVVLLMCSFFAIRIALL